MVLNTFSYDPDAQAVINAFSSAGAEPNSRRKYSIHHLVKTLKDRGVWNNLRCLYVLATDSSAQARVNWKSPGTNDLTVNGSPAFTALVGYNANGSASNYLDTGITLTSIDPANVSIGCSVDTTTATNANGDMGAINGASNGVSVNVRGSSSGPRFRMMGAEYTTTIGGTSLWNALSFHAASRNNTSTFDAYRMSRLAGSPSSGSASITSSVTVTLLKVNGAATQSSRTLSMAFLGRHLTESQMGMLYSSVQNYIEVQRYGDVDYHEPGYAPASQTFDAVVYGATAQGVVAAYELARQGKSVALVGGWRERQLGGVSSGGLGYLDFDNLAGIGGLVRDIFQAVRTDQGLDFSSLRFSSKNFLWQMRKMLDPARSGGQAVPVYWSNGVASVSKTGTRINSFTTVDGKTYHASYFMDCTYEGDLMALSGCSFIIGREAAGSGAEANNGYLGIQTDNGFQFRCAGVLRNVDPYNTPGDSGSGLIHGVYALPGTAVGSADGLTQPYNFRLAISNTTELRLPFSATPPPDYNVAHYEPLLRLMAFGNLTTAEMLTLNTATGVNDKNNGGAFSTDFFYGSDSYTATSAMAPAAAYAARETIWKEHENYIRGFFHVVVHDADSRAASQTVRTTFSAYGYNMDYHLDPHPNDVPHFPTQLYVREFRRMIGDVIWNGNDLASTDGTTPRSTKTISTVSYVMDSHHMTRYVDPNGGTPRIWNSGQVDVASGGVDEIAPLPIEVILPQAAECTNLVVPFCVSATHVAFGAIRMEFTSMQAADSGAMAICEAMANGNQDLQSISYSNLRTAILALPDSTPAVLPQLN